MLHTVILKKEKLDDLDTSDLLDAIRNTEEVLDLAVVGVLNKDYQPTPNGLYWIQSFYRDLVNELVKRADKGFTQPNPVKNNVAID